MVLWMRCTGGATVSDPCRVQLQLSTTVNNSKLSGFSRRWWSASIEEHFKFFHQKRATRYCTPFLLVWTTSDSSEMACALLLCSNIFNLKQWGFWPEATWASLTLGQRFDRSLVETQLPRNLRSLTFGEAWFEGHQRTLCTSPCPMTVSKYRFAFAGRYHPVIKHGTIKSNI